MDDTTRLVVTRVAPCGIAEHDLAPKNPEAAEVADLLAQFPDYRVRVEGHGDNGPMGPR